MTRSPSGEGESTLPDPTSLELTMGGVKLVSFVFTIALYTREPLSRHGPALVALQQRYFELCSDVSGWLYGTENMNRHKPANTRTLGMIATWTKPNAPAREFMALDIKNGVFNGAPEHKFQIRGTEPGSAPYEGGDANLVVLDFPASWGHLRVDDLHRLALDMFGGMPIVSGHAGFALEVSPYMQTGAEVHGLLRSLRHCGVDLNRPSEDRRAVAGDGLKTVGWLTALGPQAVDELGGAAKLAKGLGAGATLIPMSSGAVFQAGPRPEAGDRNRRDNLPAYRAVFERVRPLIERTADRTSAVWVGGAPDPDRTREWLLRLAQP